MTQPTPERHESYGKMSFAAGQGSGVHLFGTSIVHSNYVIMEISTALLERNLSQDWVRSEDTLLRVAMSWDQFAAAVIGAGQGGSTPVTLQYVRGDERPREDPPKPRHREQFREELEAQLSGVLEELEEIAQGATGRLRRRLKGLGDRLRNQLPFLRDQFQRHTNRTVVEARADLGSALAPPADSVAFPGLPAAPETEEDGPEMQNTPPPPRGAG